MNSNDVKVQTRTVKLNAPPPPSCNISPCIPSACASSCPCFLLLSCIKSFTAQNADVVVHKRPEQKILITLTPSKHVQNTMFISKSKCLIRIRTFKYPIKNKNQKIAYTQYVNEKGILVNKNVHFNSKGKIIHVK
ncbi:hypothetical protein LC087_17575 [Bacillus carboniphilus]|uniref:Uncharacterized protein n=1 Tax=Bacillus carboniphilus TaxID=86663 RepID=A0ABY9JW32_9BACI|nr:hypothetical protein [Bacillus carboniphilus]WLR42483.1 hypothetical protein LC087_17575 [Bacillus carboniphilus]